MRFLSLSSAANPLRFVAVAALVLNGRGGMPRFKDDLGDAQIAAALTFVRSAWGNRGSAVSTLEVERYRTGASD